MPPTFTPLSFNTQTNRIMVVVLPTRGAPVRTIIVVILLFLIGRGSRSRIHSATIASCIILSNFYLVPGGTTALKFLNSTKLGKQYQNDMFVGDYNNGNLSF
jgi:hypothetical protein